MKVNELIETNTNKGNMMINIFDTNLTLLFKGKQEMLSEYAKKKEVIAWCITSNLTLAIVID